MKRVNIGKLVGSNAISIQSGKKLYTEIHKEILQGGRVELDFSGVTVASPFLNVSIGLLLKDISVTQLQDRLVVENISDVGRGLLNHVIANALEFYKNSGTVSSGIDTSLGKGND